MKELETNQTAANFVNLDNSIIFMNGKRAWYTESEIDPDD